MGLLSKLKSALGFGAKASPAQQSQGKDNKSRGGQQRHDGRRNQKDRGPTRSRSARPRNASEGGDRPTEGKSTAHAPRNRQQDGTREERSPRRQDRSRREGGESRREGGERRRDNRRGPSRHRGERRDRPERGPRHTPASQERPGGAFSPEQLKAYAEAHAAWDVSSYQVPEAEGKKRFVDFGLPSEILHAVADLEFQYCTPIQAQSLEFSLAGKNVAGRAQTGTGKTAAFLIAVLTRYLRTPEKRNLKPGVPRALILAPTRELVIQICKDAEALGKYCGDVRSLAVYGGMDYDRQRRELEEAPVDLLVATPGRLKDYMRHHIVDLRQVDTLVIDEADRMLDMGFMPDVRAIVNRLPDRDHRCTMLYSATLNDTVMNLAAMFMRDPVRVEVDSESLATDTVKQVVYIARAEEKFKLLFNHLAHYPEARTIIFCNRKFTTERISENLRRRGIESEVLSGDVNQVRRLKILEDFRAGKIRTVVATDVAGRGIHVDDISFVVNYDFPYEPEDYVHRIGRTGRAGQTGTAISFADEDESFIIPDIEAYINEPLKCTMPEEWMYADLPEPKPRGKKRPSSKSGELQSERRAESEERKVESGDETLPVTPEVTPPVSEATLATSTPPEEPKNSPSDTPAPSKEEDLSVSASTEKTPSSKTGATPDAPASLRSPLSALRSTSGEAPRSEARRNKEVRPEREPRFRPHHMTKPQAKATPPAKSHAPRREKPVAQRWARTQADGPRDGSESHHAQPITARPIYMPTGRGPVTDEWTPGQ